MRKRQNAKCEENNLCDGVLVPSVQILREPGWRVVTCCCWRGAQHNSSYQAPSHTFCEILLNDDLFPWERPNVNYSNDLNVKCLLCSEHRCKMQTYITVGQFISSVRLGAFIGLWAVIVVAWIAVLGPFRVAYTDHIRAASVTGEQSVFSWWYYSFAAVTTLHR